MPKQLRWTIKQLFAQAKNNLEWGFHHLNRIREIYLQNDAPEYAERVELVMNAIVEIAEAIDTLYDIA